MLCAHKQLWFNNNTIIKHPNCETQSVHMNKNNNRGKNNGDIKEMLLWGSVYTTYLMTTEGVTTGSP